jgi:hypothetical protein
VYAVLLADFLPSHRPAPRIYLAVFGLYLAILILIKEVGREDYETFRKMLGV